LSLIDEERADQFAEFVDRLSRQSVVPRHFDAYGDIPWDEPAFRIDPGDPRWSLSSDHGLGATRWYRSQTSEVQARLGLHSIGAAMKAGLQFESVLKRGLLEFASVLPDRSAEFRYAYHEVIEEAQHSLMFQEFVNRSGVDVPELSWDFRVGARHVISSARRFPASFFVFVLGGKDPIDYVQRAALQSGRELHPLLERIMTIHVTEEARHLSFARQYLRVNVPLLTPKERRRLTVQAPFLLAGMATVMLRPPRALVRTYRVPSAAMAEAYGRRSAARDVTRASLREVRELLGELDLVTPASKRLWQALGIWEPRA
jgi:hypothetical protein